MRQKLITPANGRSLCTTTAHHSRANHPLSPYLLEYFLCPHYFREFSKKGPSLPGRDCDPEFCLPKLASGVSDIARWGTGAALPGM